MFLGHLAGKVEVVVPLEEEEKDMRISNKRKIQNDVMFKNKKLLLLLFFVAPPIFCPFILAKEMTLNTKFITSLSP